MAETCSATMNREAPMSVENANEGKEAKRVIPPEHPLLTRGSLLPWVPVGICLRFDVHTEFYGDVLV